MREKEFIKLRIRRMIIRLVHLRSTKSKASGKYELKSLTATDWIVTVSATGYVTQNVSVTIVTGQTLTKDFSLVAV